MSCIVNEILNPPLEVPNEKEAKKIDKLQDNVDEIKETRVDLQEKAKSTALPLPVREEAFAKDQRMEHLQHKAEERLFEMISRREYCNDCGWYKGACLLVVLVIIGIIIYWIPQLIDN